MSGLPGQTTVLLLLALLAVRADLVWVVGDPNGYSQKSLTSDAPSRDAFRGKATLPGGRTLLVSARYRDEDDVLLVDRDFDGDLGNEEPIRMVRTGTMARATVEVEATLPGEEVPRKIPLHFTHHGGSADGCLHFVVPVHREGEVVVEGRARRIALFDETTLALDLDGDGKLPTDANSPERVRPGEPFRVGDRGYVAVLDDAGVEIRPADVVPPPPAPRWSRFGVSAAGRKAPGGSRALADLLKDLDAAEKDDRKVNATYTFNRRKVIEEIGKLGTPDALKALLGLLKKIREDDLLAVAVRSLGWLEYAEESGRVADLATGARDPGVRTAAIEALHGMGAPDREAVLASALRSAPNESVADVAARHLAWVGTPSAFALLREVAADPAREDLRYGAYQALSRYSGSPPAPELIAAAARAPGLRLRALGLADARESGHPEARAFAMAAAAAPDANEEIRREVTETLGRRGDPEATGVLLGMADLLQAGVRSRVVDLLRPVRDPDSVARLVAALAGPSRAARILAAEVLEGIPGDAAVSGLLARLDAEKDPEVLAAILAALARPGAEGSVKAIVAAAGKAKGNPDVVRSALEALGRIGLGNPRVLGFFEELCRSKEWPERVLALDAAAATRDELAADMLLSALADDEWQVRLAAAQGLGLVRVRRAVLPLIERLEKEESKRVIRAVAETLRRTTGQNFYDLAPLWRKWWKESGETFEVPAEPPEPKVEEGHGLSVADFYGVPVDTDRVVFVLDQSGSMSGDSGSPGKNKLEMAKEQTLKAAGRIGKGARLNVILFESTVHPWQKGLVPANPRSLAGLKAHLEDKQPTGGTNLFDALEMALLTPEVDTVFLLSDGMPGSGKFVRADDILREVRRINQTRRIAIHCISLGMDSQLLKDLAAEHGGSYVRR